MLNRKVLSFLELTFIIFSSNSLNLRKYHTPTDAFDLFFYSVTIFSIMILIISYIILSIKQQFPLEKNLFLIYSCICILILGMYLYHLNKYDIINSVFYIYLTITILLIFKTLVYSFHLFRLLSKQKRHN